MSVDPGPTRLVTEVLTGSALAQRPGIPLGSLEPHRVVLRMLFRSDNVTVGLVVHGEATATVINAAGAATSASSAPAKIKSGVTSTLTSSDVPPADGADLSAEARAIHPGRSRTGSDVEVRDPAGRLIAKGARHAPAGLTGSRPKPG